QIIPDASTRTNAMQSESVQAIDSVPYLSIDQLGASHTVESVPGFGLLFAMFNNAEDNPFSDVRNRQAFLYAIDMDAVIDNGLSGEAEAATSFLHADHPNHQEASTVYSLDQDRARQLFEETGLTSFRMMVTDHDWIQLVSASIHESLTEVGITVSFDVVIAPGDPSVFGDDPDLLMRWWYGNATWTDQRMNWEGTESYEQVQDLLDQGLQALDETEQQEIWGQLFDLLSEEVPL